MLCKDVMDVIEAAYPREYALDWDNVGLLVGRDDKEVRRIYIALDATDEVIDAAIESQADMLVTHHPMIFGALKRINNLDFIGNRILKLIQSDISYYAMHTNYDVLGMARLSGEKMNLSKAEVLEATCENGPSDNGEEGIGRVADLDHPVTLQECGHEVKKSFQLNAVKIFGDLDARVRRIAISPGSGKSMIKAALDKKADVLITGDIGHHEGIDAVAQGLAVIDAGHYGIEHIFMEDMRQYLGSYLTDVEVMAAPIVHPFTIM